jgi:hypothetical protein
MSDDIKPFPEKEIRRQIECPLKGTKYYKILSDRI